MSMSGEPSPEARGPRAEKNGVDRRRFLRSASVLGGTVGLGLGLPGCTTGNEGDAGEPAAKGGAPATSKPRRGNGQYVEVLALTSLPYFIDHKAGMDAAGRYFGVQTRFVGPSEFDIDAMVTTMEQYISQGVSGLVVVGFDPALAPSINRAVKAGIPTVTVDADVPDSDRLAFLGTGNEEAGRLGARELLSQMGSKKDSVLIVTRTGQSNLEERVRGYRSELEREGVRVRVANDDSDAAKAASAVSDALRSDPDLSGIACVEAAGGTGAATALREAKRAGDVKCVAMDRDEETLAEIERGTIQASVAQKSALMTYWAVAMLHQLQTAEVPITRDNAKAQISPLPPVVDTGAELITKANVGLWKKAEKS